MTDLTNRGSNPHVNANLHKAGKSLIMKTIAPIRQAKIWTKNQMEAYDATEGRFNSVQLRRKSTAMALPPLSIATNKQIVRDSSLIELLEH
jgi:hypothetical protein